ncbi:hypothetical protein FHT00_001998 [Sphingomonas insulae]|uniref:Haemolysin activator HlyB C-terminal domain-containing protein n=1 Tax=Sphingomonas insulae TaxID=424800 RepID=A0ABP3SU08_9SPHN|nr:hypothetical protein [Sphingomonas insulae]NIJ30035.1 hypothetical protein [Sphingomonas insulae]
MTGGRPLRFLAILLSGWATARGIDIYNGAAVALPHWIAPVARVIASLGSTAADAAPLPVGITNSPRRAARTIAMPAGPGLPHARLAAARADRAVPAPSVMDGQSIPPRSSPSPLLSPAVLPPSIVRSGPRLAGSAWLIARGGSTASVSGSQLGASQAGARITYALGSGRRVALAARVSAPLAGRGKEAAIGFDWQPIRAPIHIVAEQRFALDGGRGGAMLGVVGGFGPAMVARGLQLEGYGQAGVIVRGGGEGFADGALRASHPLSAIGALRVDIGAGIWGGAQRSAARVDVGPSIGVVVPAGHGAIRLTADWRQRIAGTSRPGSGPALSIGTNF